MRKPTAGPRPCACGCGTILPETFKHPPQRYLDQKHFKQSTAYDAVRRVKGSEVAKRYHEAHTCPCAECVQLRAADRSDLVAKVAAEMGVPVATGPAKKRRTDPAFFEEMGARRRAYYAQRDGSTWT